MQAILQLIVEKYIQRNMKMIFYIKQNSFYIENTMFSLILIFIHSLHWHVQNVTIPSRSQELLPFLFVMNFFLPTFSTNYSSVLPHFILPSISWSNSQPHCFQIHIEYPLGILFSSILCTCPNQHNLFNLIISVIVGFLTIV